MPKRVIKDQAQLQLFKIDISNINLRELADSIGLDWWAAKKLCDDNWLSFDPDLTIVNDQSQIAEFHFLGSLVAAGCDPRMLKRMLSGLEKPYCYNLSEIYYDWEEKEWQDFPEEKDPLTLTYDLIAELEENEDVDELDNIYTSVKDALDHLGKASNNYKYLFNPELSDIIQVAKLLLWKIAKSSISDDPKKKIIIGKLFGILQNLPKAIIGEYIRVDLKGPKRKDGTHEIFHFWTMELRDDGTISISSGGWFSRPESGGESFSSMSWEVSPGFKPEFNDYLHALELVDDADTFENEVLGIDLKESGYKLEVEDMLLEKEDMSSEDEEVLSDE